MFTLSYVTTYPVIHIPMREHVGVSLQLPVSVHVTDAIWLENPGSHVNAATLPKVVLEKS